MSSTLKSPPKPLQAALLLGPPKSGKTRRVLEQLEQSIHNSLLLVPSHRDIASVKSALAARGLAFFSDGIVTFDGLSRKILEDHGIYTPVLDDARRLWLLRSILAEMEAQKKLRFLPGVRGNYGFLKTLSDFFKELKHAEIFYQKLEEGLRRKGPDPKDAEILEIYARYQKGLLAHNTFDREGLLWQAKNILERGATCEGAQHLLVDGFDSFTPTQLAFLQSLARTAQAVTFTLTLENYGDSSFHCNPGMFTHVEQTRRQLAERFAIKEEWLQTAPPKPRILLQEATDIFAETRWCAREAKKIWSQETPGHERIAICARNLGLYEKSLIRELQRHRLPWKFSTSRAIAQTSACLFASSFVQAHLSGELHDVLAFLRSPWIDATLRQRGLPDGEWISRAFGEGGIAELTGYWQTRLRWALKERIPRHPLALESLPEKFDEITRELNQWPAMQTAEAHRKTLSERLAAWEISADTPVLVKEWEAFWRAVQSYTVFRRNWSGPQQAMSLEEFWDDLSPYLRETKIRNDEGESGIEILQAHELRGISFSTLFVLGVNENVFPSPGPSHGLHSAQERRRMIEAGLELQDKGDAESHRAREAFLFYRVMHCAQETLFLSAHKNNPLHKECLPSSFFREMRNASPGPSIVAFQGAWKPAKPV